jgi:hypothetical protein
LEDVTVEMDYNMPKVFVQYDLSELVCVEHKSAVYLFVDLDTNIQIKTVGHYVLDDPVRRALLEILMSDDYLYKKYFEAYPSVADTEVYKCAMKEVGHLDEYARKNLYNIRRDGILPSLENKTLLPLCTLSIENPTIIYCKPSFNYQNPYLMDGSISLVENGNIKAINEVVNRMTIPFHMIQADKQSILKIDITNKLQRS